MTRALERRRGTEMRTELTKRQRAAARPRDTDLAVPAPGVSAKAGEELQCQRDSAIAFADYCAFLSAGQSSDRAAQLIDLVETLFRETMQVLVDDRPQGR